MTLTQTLTLTLTLTVSVTVTLTLTVSVTVTLALILALNLTPTLNLTANPREHKWTTDIWVTRHMSNPYDDIDYDDAVDCDYAYAFNYSGSQTPKLNPKQAYNHISNQLRNLTPKSKSKLLSQP